MNNKNPMVQYGIDELKRAGFYDENSDYNGEIGKVVEELLKTFANQHHSGMSGAIVLNLFNKLARFTPLTPLTGEDDEWYDDGDKNLQNKRMPGVFKDKKTGKVYYIDGRVFITKDGVSFTCKDSKKEIQLPCIPKTEYIYEGTPEAEPFKQAFE